MLSVSPLSGSLLVTFDAAARFIEVADLIDTQGRVPQGHIVHQAIEVSTPSARSIFVVRGLDHSGA